MKYSQTSHQNISHMFTATLIGILLTSITACQTVSEPTDKTQSNEDNMVICTMHYDPVCASVRDKNGVVTQQTFGNSCTTQHAKGKVLKITEGVCE